MKKKKLHKIDVEITKEKLLGGGGLTVLKPVVGLCATISYFFILV
jgi:hypothetical protein